MAALNCDPAALVAAAKCFECIPREMRKTVELFLLARLNGLSDPAAITAAAAAFRSIPREMQESVEIYLLCKLDGG